MSPFNDPFASSRPPLGGRPPGSNIPYRPGPGNAPKPSGRPSWAAKPASYYFGDQQGPPPNPNLDSYNSQNANMWDIPTDYDPTLGAPPVSRPPPIGTTPPNVTPPPPPVDPDPTREERLRCKSQGGTWKGNKQRGVCVMGDGNGNGSGNGNGNGNGGGGGGGGTDLGRTRPGEDPHGTLLRDLGNPVDTLDERGVQTNVATGYRKVLPSTRESGERERNTIYNKILQQLQNPNTESDSKLRSLYEGVPGFTKNLVGDWRNDDYGLLGDVRSRFSQHGEEGAGDSTKNLIAERGAGAIRGFHDDISRNRASAFARNPYSVDSNLGPDTLGKTGQAFADNSRNAAFQGGLLDQRAKEFGLGGIKDIDFARFGASERGDERYRGTGAATEFGIRDRDDTNTRDSINKLLGLYGGVHGPSAMEAGYDISRRGQDLEQILSNQNIISRDYFGGQGREFEREQSTLDRSLVERGQDKGVETARANRAPWWSFLIPDINVGGGG